jgi:tetratricopeptide (TPR) repeat protein
MHEYGVRDVERLLHLPRSTIRRLIGAGFVSPARGPRGQYRFSFQDLIVMRTAQALAAAKVPPRRITRSLKELRRQLPDSVPLSGLSICAVADRVVVKDGDKRWLADSGQYLLALDIDRSDGALSVMERREAPAESRAEDWFVHGCELERDDPHAARAAYERAIVADPEYLSARINLGRLLHESGRLDDAEAAYRKAFAVCGADATLLYNLAVLLEDMRRKDEAMPVYQQALRNDPTFADCHYNLSLLYEGMGKRREALRHMAQYRRLTGTKPD